MQTTTATDGKQGNGAANDPAAERIAAGLQNPGEKLADKSPENPSGAQMVSKEDAERMVREAVEKAVGEGAEKLRVEQVKDEMIRRYIPDLPLSFRPLLPATKDEAEFRAAATKLGEELGAFWLKRGGKIPDVGGANRDGGTTAREGIAKDYQPKNNSPVDRIAGGLK